MIAQSSACKDACITVKDVIDFPALLIWLAYFLVPTSAGGIVHGIPLAPVDAAALLMLAWLWMAGRHVAWAWLAGAVLVATAVASAAIPGEGGFRARYFASTAAGGAHERSTEFPEAAFTRIDRRLDFAPDGPEFPLPFFNDNSRFNFYKAGEPNRRLLGFAVRWSGLWWVDEERLRLYLDAPAASAHVFVDGAAVMAIAPDGSSPAAAELTLTRGWHRLDVGYASPYGNPRRFSAGVLDGAARRPFDDAMVVTQQIRPWQMTAAGVLRWVKQVVDIVALGWVTWIFATSLMAVLTTFRQGWRATGGLREAALIFAAAAAIEAMIFGLPWFTHNMVLNGGDDTMTYEGYARDILLNGMLMNGGLPPGQGEPFYYQAFYPYFLAAVHYLFGESMFGPVLMQRLLAAAAIWMLVRIALEYTAARAWVVVLPLAAAFIMWKFWPIAAQPLNESLYVPLLVASAWSLIRTCRGPRWPSALTAGVLAGLTTITRSTALLAWAVAWPATWLQMKGVERRTRLIAIVAASCLAIFSMVAVRNWIVARVFAPTSTEFGVTLLGGNEIPPGVTIDPAPRAALYLRFRIAEPTVLVIEYALTEPALFATNLGRKALFALGFYEPYAPGWGWSPVYVAVWTSAIAGVILALRGGNPAIPVLLPPLIALTQYAAVVIVYPKGERLIVPIHALLVPYSCIAFSYLIDRLTGTMSRGPSV